MAPEFFPLIGSFAAFVVLAAAVLATPVLGVGLLLWAHYNKHLRLVLRLTSAFMFGAVLPLATALFIVGRHVRQEYFLNEPLVTACANGDLSQAKHLLQCGASPDTCNEAYMTPLMYAAANGHRDIVALLLQRGANVRLRDFRGKTAAQLAEAAGHSQIATMVEPP